MYIFEHNFMDSDDISLLFKRFMLDQLSQLVWFPTCLPKQKTLTDSLSRCCSSSSSFTDSLTLLNVRLMFVGVLSCCLLIVGVPRVVIAAGVGVPVVTVAGDDVTLPHSVPLAHAGGGSTSSLVVPCWHLGSTNILKYKYNLGFLLHFS